MCLTKVDPEGRPLWSEPITRLPVVQGIPVQQPIGLATDPHGGVCVTWIENGALCLARFSDSGVTSWERRFPFRGSLDPNVTIATDASGATTLSGRFTGTIRFEGGAQPSLRSQGSDRFLARVQLDGCVRWSRVLHSARAQDYSTAVHRDGTMTIAAVVKPREGDGRDPASRDLCFITLDAQGSTATHTRILGAPHTCAQVTIASTGAGALAFAGYFSGGFTIDGREVRSGSPAGESVFVGRLDGPGGTWARALHGPELQAGLSVHGDTSGAVVIAGWFAAGLMDLGGVRLAAADRAVLFVARYT